MFVAVLAAFLFNAPPVYAVDAPSNIKSLGKELLFTGRMDFGDPDGVRWDWAGSQVSFNTDAKSLVLGLVDGGCDYNVLVDGKQADVIKTLSHVKAYTLRLPGEGVRNVIISKRNGPNYGAGVLTGIDFSDESKFYDPPARLKRRIEFIGDSFTVGYGNEGPGKECASLREFENNWLSFANMTARELKAEAHITAISGQGVVRNYGEKNKVSKTNIPYYYGRTLMSADKAWDFKKWQADAVVIKLGTNDHSTQPWPDEEVFVSALHDLMKRVRAAYGGGVPVFLVTDNGIGVLKQRVERVHAELQEQFANSFFVIFPGFVDSDLGCHWHPKVVLHEKYTKTLVPVMREALGWEE